jgi:acetyl-CoA carboxylase carboxyltransferase component
VVRAASAAAGGERGSGRVNVLESLIDTGSAGYAENRVAMLERLAELDSLLAETRAGGSERSVARHRARGKLTVRERIELLLDRDGWFLELSPLAAWGTDFKVGASMVTGIGLVNGVECLIAGNDPTVRGGTLNPWGVRRWLRASDIAAANRLPVIQLVESGGADLPSQAETFVDGGRTFYDLARLSAAGIPTIAVVFGNATAGGAYIPGMSDYSILIRERSKVFLGGPPLVKMATGEDADDEALGGGEMHATRSGLADHLADDEPDALRIARDIVGHLGWRKLGPPPRLPAVPPLHDPEELLGLVPADPKQPFDAREVLARVVDGSQFEEFKPLYGRTLVTGWASVHGYRVGVLANNGVLFNEEAEKATQFIGLANQLSTPLLFLQNTTGYVIGTTYEQRGIVKNGAKMVRAVSTSTVPHITLMFGGSWGAGNYGMSGRAYAPRFVFTWPNHRIGVMGPKQLAGVMSIVGRAAAEARGIPFDEQRDQAMQSLVVAQLEHESSALFATGRLWDDGIIDPRDTRTVLGIALAAVHNAPVKGTTDLGPVRM